MRFLCIGLLVALAGAGCSDDGEEAKAAAAAKNLSENDLAMSHGLGGGQGAREQEEDTDIAKRGGNRWKDTGVYLDGKPIGFMNFGELPIALQPVWKEEKVSADIRPGSHDPGYRIVKQRHYRFDEYLAALGVDLHKVKEIHVYGPRYSDSIIASGAELRRRGKDFLFRFGAETGGKAIPVVPPHFGNGRSPDKISGVMIYIDKKPPKLVWNVGLELDGQIIKGVPYFGEPVRGGVRVYFDDHLASIIKRKMLPEKVSERGPDGKICWKLFPFLESQGVDTSKIAEGWLIRDERRRERLTHDQLAGMTFTASDGGRGQIFLGPEKLPASVLALHSKPLRPDELPHILPEEDDD